MSNKNGWIDNPYTFLLCVACIFILAIAGNNYYSKIAKKVRKNTIKVKKIECVLGLKQKNSCRGKRYNRFRKR